MGTAPSRFHGLDRPVESVSWHDCQGFCAKLSELTGRVVELPGEAEWEYACRAGTATAYHTGNGAKALRLAGWYRANSRDTTHPVGRRAPNGWGLFDTHGNVWEWCQTRFRRDPAGADRQDVGGSEEGPRAMRGGSYNYPPQYCPAAFRGQGPPEVRASYIGFRVCLRPG
jgi:formylglycine-generating enzyme required for sulfatase activity